MGGGRREGETRRGGDGGAGQSLVCTSRARTPFGGRERPSKLHDNGVAQNGWLDTCDSLGLTCLSNSTKQTRAKKC